MHGGCADDPRAPALGGANTRVLGGASGRSGMRMRGCQGQLQPLGFLRRGCMNAHTEVLSCLCATLRSHWCRAGSGTACGAYAWDVLRCSVQLVDGLWWGALVQCLAFAAACAGGELRSTSMRRGQAEVHQHAHSRTLVSNRKGMHFTGSSWGHHRSCMPSHASTEPGIVGLTG